MYCTLNDAKTMMKAGTDSQAAEDDVLMRLVKRVTGRINQIMAGRSEEYLFLPQIKTRTVPLDGYHINTRLNTLALKWPLLALTSVSADGTSVTSVAAGYPQGETPYRQIRISSSGDLWYNYISTTCEDPAYAEIAGVWGWHSDYTNAWQNSGATLNGNINASVTTLDTSGIDDDDPFGFPVRISRGALIKIDDEYLFVTGTTAASEEATVARGMLGSTAAAHSNGATIYVWQVEEPIRHLTARQAAFMYARLGAYEQSTFDGAQSVQYPPDLLREVKAVLTEYMNS